MTTWPEHFDPALKQPQPCSVCGRVTPAGERDPEGKCPACYVAVHVMSGKTQPKRELAKLKARAAKRKAKP